MMGKLCAVLACVVGTTSLCGCTTAKRVYIKHGETKQVKRQRAYFADPNHDFIKDIESSGLTHVDFVAKQLEFKLLEVVMSTDTKREAERQTLAEIFYDAIDSPENDTAMKRYWYFISCDKMADFSRPLVTEILAEPSSNVTLSPEQLKVLEAAILQYYRTRLDSKSDPEKYAAGRLEIVLENLPQELRRPKLPASSRP